MTQCVFTPRAEADLDDIWYDVACDNVEVADKLIDRIRARCESHAVFPLSGERQDHLIPHLRRIIEGPYLIFYFPTPNGISVIRILHGKRDLDRLFR